ncbi:MAG: hypothetical protein IJU51_06165 [Clostridia bacterium]|nr:hypothetical protein [Clostridia bacterium]
MKGRAKRLSLTDRLCEYSSFLKYNTVETGKTEKRKRMEKIISTAIENELTDRQKDCLRYYYYDGMRVDDIAGIMGLRPTTVYKHIRLAKKALKKCAAYL